MRSIGTVFALFLLGSLTGCTGTPALTAVDAAPKTAQPTQTAGTHHNYQLYGTPKEGEFMVDADTGKVWELKASGGQQEFVPVPVAQDNTPRFNPKTGKIEAVDPKDPLGLFKN